MQNLATHRHISSSFSLLDPFAESCSPGADPLSLRSAAAAGQAQDAMLSTIAMAQLIVRDIDKKLVDLLKRRAAAHGRSAEAEHREILRAVLQPPPMVSLKDHLLDMPDVGDDADFAIERSRARKVSL
jgi:plasmid stability protein